MKELMGVDMMGMLGQHKDLLDVKFIALGNEEGPSKVKE